MSASSAWSAAWAPPCPISSSGAAAAPRRVPLRRRQRRRRRGPRRLRHRQRSANRLRRGRFIAFCGGEGAGKSTQIGLLAEHLTNEGRDVLLTREHGGTAEGRELRRLLLTPGVAWSEMAETLLMVADRVQHIARTIQPALAAGQHV